MTTQNVPPVKHESSSPLADRIETLKTLFPEVASEDGIDFDALADLLGKSADRSEKYNFSWWGKQEAMRSLSQTSQATLKPAPEESVNWDDTENLFIEGENLEVLKLLHKSYAGRVKMIYIDPPYNTGNDYVYPDNYADPLDHYLRETGQVDENGNFQTSKPEESGRKHSRWLGMMYPRLALARQLLRDDGVIFVSIDDNEVHHLRLLMNMVFGEENFVSCLVWEGGIKNDARYISISHDYILCFCKRFEGLNTHDERWRIQKSGIDEIYAKCNQFKEHRDNDFRQASIDLQKWYNEISKSHPSWRHRHYKHIDEAGVFFASDISWPGGGGPTYEVLHPDTGLPVKTPERGWRFAKKTTMMKEIANNRVFFGENENKIPTLKTYLHETEGQVLPSVIYQDRRSASKRLRSLFNDEVFDNPKDENIIADLIDLPPPPPNKCSNPHIILDFFAGSATTAHAVLQQNREDGGNRRFIMVQLPETMQHPEYANIAEVGKERIRRVIQRLEAERNGRLDSLNQREDLGFRVYKLDKSPRRQWQDLPPDTTAEQYQRQLELMIEEPLVKSWTVDEVIADVAIKEAGFGLSYRVEQISFSQQTIHKVIDDEREQHFYICLDECISFEAVRQLGLHKDDLFIFRDSAVGDSAIANLALTCRVKSL